jgi:hypothetical protein
MPVIDMQTGLPRDTNGEPPDNGAMEARVAKLEASSEFVRTQLADLRVDMNRQMTDLRADVRELRGDMKLLLGAIVGVALGLAGLMAKGFHWL